MIINFTIVLARFGCLITVCLHVYVRLEKFGEQNDGFVRFWHI